MANTTLKFDVLEKHKGERAIKQVGDDADRSAGKLAAFNRTGSKVLGELKSSASGVAAGIGSAIKPAAAFAATGASLASVAGPAAIGLTNLAFAGVQMATSLGLASAILPSIVGGALLVKKTVASTGPAMAKAFTPVTNAFSKGQSEIDKIATKGLPQLARSFVKVNFPAIHASMEEIATATNDVVRDVGKWVNSAHGQEAIATIVETTSAAAAELRPEISALAISFGELVRRGGDQGIVALATGLNRAAVGAKKLIDGISGEDITRGMDAVAGWGQRLLGFGKIVVDAGVWMHDNEAKVKGFSDALAGVGIALGILSGNPIGVLIGGLTLLANHWDEVKGAVSGAVTWFRTSQGATQATSGVMSTLRGVVADLHSWWAGSLLPALRAAGQQVLPALVKAGKDVSRSLEENRDAVGKARAIFDAFGVILVRGVIPTVSLLARTLIPLLTSALTGIISAINTFVLPGIRIFVRLALDQFGAIVNGAASAFGWIPGIGPRLQGAAKQFNSFRAEVNRALDGIVDRNITITARYRAVGDVGIVTGRGTSSGSMKVLARAGGGPVDAGRPYLVGEQGPELFTPMRAGQILSAPKTASVMSSPGSGGSWSGGGATYHVTVNVNGPTMTSAQQFEAMVLRAIDSARGKGKTRLRTA